MFKTNSSVHGTGGFADRAYHIGDLIGHFMGEPLTPAEWEAHPNPDHCMQVGTNSFIGPADHPIDWTNHSCSPNAGVVLDYGRAALVAITFIARGEEITWDYATTWGDADPTTMECRCGRVACRKIIGPWSTLPEETKEWYRSLGVAIADSYATPGT